MFTPKIRFYLLVCLLYTACRNDRLQTATYAPSIEMALQRAASTAAQTDYRGAITLLQAVLKTLPAPVQRDTPTDKVYHKLGVYYQLWSVEQQGFALQQRCADTSITFFKQALEIRQRILGNHWMTCKTRLNIGTLFKDFQNDYFSAQAHLEQSLFTAQTDTVGMAKHAPFLEAEILYNLGVALVKLGDYDLAQAHAVRADSLYKALKVLKESDDSNDFQNYINNLLNLGDIYAVHQPPMALECFNALQNMVQKRQIPTDIALTAVLNRGIALRRQQKWHLAELDLQKAQRMATVRADSANIHIELAKLYLDTKAYAMAESHALSAMRLRQEYPKGHPVWAEIHTVLGAIYLKINLLEKAKKAFESAVGEDLGNSTVPAVWQLEALSQLADLQAKTDLEGAAKSYQRLSDGLYARKSFLQTDAAKLNWTQQARDIFSKSISLNRQLHEKTGQMAYLNQILTDMERSKAVLMSEMIQDARIGQYADVPNSVRKAEHALRLSVAQAERNLNNNPSLFQQNQMDLSKKYQDWQSFVQVLGQKYPKYFHFKHQQNHAVAVADVQKKLPKATGLIHYYLNNNVLHILAMDKSMAKVYELPLTAAFDTAFHRYQRIISQSKWDWKQNALFSQASYQLYQYLLAKPLSDLQHCTTLITVPDEKLANLSFAALFTAPQTLGEAHDEPYLIKKYALNMAYTLADGGLEAFRQGNLNSEFVYAGFSHDFKNLAMHHLASKALEILPDSKKHLEIMHQKFNRRGKTYMNPEMTLEAFKSIAPKSRIAEIVSHAGFDERDVRRSVIAFPTADSLTWFDIHTVYNMDWSQNQLIALIACETGKGLPVRGETVISMGYAFGYAGSQRRIAALWSIPHLHSMQLMEAFLGNLGTQPLPAQALQQAQIQFLQSGASANKQTPNLWAGLTLSGNIAPLSE